MAGWTKEGKNEKILIQLKIIVVGDQLSLLGFIIFEK